MRNLILEPKLSLGMILATPAAMEATTASERESALRRHLRGDWGDCDKEDAQTNDEALKHGDRILSVYVAQSSGQKFWVITEADRSSTTILLPEDY